MGHNREHRVALICALLIICYGSFVAAVAALTGQLPLISINQIGAPITAIWVISLAFVFCAYGLDLLLRRRPEQPLQVLFEDARAYLLQTDWLIARGTIIAASYGLMIFFGPMKAMVGNLRGFPWDPVFIEADRFLFFGTDPWRVTHALFGSDWATAMLQLNYNLWFALMWLGLIYCVLRPEYVALRARYVISFLLTWMLVGSFFAWLLASAGPCFYERAFGDPAFAPLMSRLRAIDGHMAPVLPGLAIHALRVQDMLWEAFAAKGILFGGGISAAPSMHVALAVLMACAGWKVSRGLGWALSVFAFFIWIGSIHLGWHYAVDGLIALPLTLAIWWFSGWLVDRFVMKEGPAALPQPALAE